MFKMNRRETLPCTPVTLASSTTISTTCWRRRFVLLVLVIVCVACSPLVYLTMSGGRRHDVSTLTSRLTMRQRQPQQQLQQRRPASDVVVLVLSSRTGLARRTAIRETWARWYPNVLFLVGNACPVPDAHRPWFLCERSNHTGSLPTADIAAHDAAVATQDARLAAEAAEFNDLLLLDMVDVYRNLPEKLKLGYMWAATAFPTARWFLKVDDDTFVHMPRLSAWTAMLTRNATIMKTPTIFAASFVRKQRPVRSPEHKWYESKALWPHDEYPPYPLGAGHMCNRVIVDYLVSRAKADELRHHQGEDVGLGIWLAESPFAAQVTYAATTWMEHHDGRKCHDADKIVVSHKITPSSMRQCHDRNFDYNFTANANLEPLPVVVNHTGWAANIDIVIPWSGIAPSVARDGVVIDKDVERDRYNGEMVYLLRSIAKHAPWVRHIWVLINGVMQPPAWVPVSLSTKITFVDRCLLLPEGTCPTRSSHAVAPFAHRLPLLAEHFLFADDDTFFGRPVTPQHFFTNGRPHVWRKGPTWGEFSGKAHHRIYKNPKAAGARDIHPQPRSAGPRPHFLFPALKSACHDLVENRFPAFFAFVASHKSRWSSRGAKDANSQEECFYGIVMWDLLVTGLGVYKNVDKEEGWSSEVWKYTEKEMDEVVARRAVFMNFNDRFDRNTTGEKYHRQMRVFHTYMERMFPATSASEVASPAPMEAVATSAVASLPSTVVPVTPNARYDIIVLVLSSRAGLVRRTAIRETWARWYGNVFFLVGRACPIPKKHLREPWLCERPVDQPKKGTHEVGRTDTDGLPPDEVAKHAAAIAAQDAKIAAEAAEFGDLLVLDMIDVYHHLAEKLKLGYVWAFAAFPTARWFLKVDDDTYVRMPLLAELASTTFVNSSASVMFAASFVHDEPPVTDDPLKAKWREWRWPHKLYPPFPRGAGHMISRPLAEYIVDRRDKLMHYQGEDVSLAIWMRQAPFDTQLMSLPSRFEGHSGHCHDAKKVVIGHNISPQRMRDCYHAVNDERAAAKSRRGWKKLIDIVISWPSLEAVDVHSTTDDDEAAVDSPVASPVRDVDHLMMLMRSIASHAPWTRRVWLLHRNCHSLPQSWRHRAIPASLRARVSCVNHDLVLPPSAPSAGNSVIVGDEPDIDDDIDDATLVAAYASAALPQLSERFLFAQHDVFVTRDVVPSDFFVGSQVLPRVWRRGDGVRDADAIPGHEVQRFRNDKDSDEDYVAKFGGGHSRAAAWPRAGQAEDVPESQRPRELIPGTRGSANGKAVATAAVIAAARPRVWHPTLKSACQTLLTKYSKFFDSHRRHRRHCRFQLHRSSSPKACHRAVDVDYFGIMSWHLMRHRHGVYHGISDHDFRDADELNEWVGSLTAVASAARQQKQHRDNARLPVFSHASMSFRFRQAGTSMSPAERDAGRRAFHADMSLLLPSPTRLRVTTHVTGLRTRPTTDATDTSIVRVHWHTDTAATMTTPVDVLASTNGCNAQACVLVTDSVIADVVVGRRNYPPTRHRATQLTALLDDVVEGRDVDDIGGAQSSPAAQTLADLTISASLFSNVPLTAVPDKFWTQMHALPIPTASQVTDRELIVIVADDCAALHSDASSRDESEDANADADAEHAVRRLNRLFVRQLMKRLHLPSSACVSLATFVSKENGDESQTTTPAKSWMFAVLLSGLLSPAHLEQSVLIAWQRNIIPVTAANVIATAMAGASRRDAFVDAADFETVSALATRLRAYRNNVQRYLSLFSYRTRAAMDTPVMRALRQTRVDGGASLRCRLCACLLDVRCRSSRTVTDVTVAKMPNGAVGYGPPIFPAYLSHLDDVAAATSIAAITRVVVVVGVAGSLFKPRADDEVIVAVEAHAMSSVLLQRDERLRDRCVLVHAAVQSLSSGIARLHIAANPDRHSLHRLGVDTNIGANPFKYAAATQPVATLNLDVLLSVVRSTLRIPLLWLDVQAMSADILNGCSARELARIDAIVVECTRDNVSKQNTSSLEFYKSIDDQNSCATLRRRLEDAGFTALGEAVFDATDFSGQAGFVRADVEDGLLLTRVRPCWPLTKDGRVNAHVPRKSNPAHCMHDALLVTQSAS